MSSPALRVVTGLDAVAEKIAGELGGKQSGNGWKCRCPAHEDTNASLSLAVKSGKLLLHCHAGCAYDAVREKLLELKLLPKKLPTQKKVIATYEYKNADGTTAFEKIRYEPKDFRIRRWDAATSEWVFRGATKDIQPVLYNLPAVLAAIRRADTIVITEGEKDADSFNALALDGLVATTNFDGAASWRPEYTAQLAGARIIILEDNDAAGRGRTLRLAAELDGVCPEVRVVRFGELPAKGDFSDWLALKSRSREDIIAKLRDNEKIAVNPWLAVEDATYEQYIDFVRTLPEFADMRSEFLSGTLNTLTKDGWKPVGNLIPVIKSHASAYDCFKLHRFEDHLARYNREIERRLLIDIPDWDGEDRIQQICNIVRMSNCEQDTFCSLLKDFCAAMFRRLTNPGKANATLIVTGPQGVGKDSLFRALFGGLATYFKTLDLRPQRETEAIKQLHKAILFNIPEFDRTSRTETAILKFILDTPSTDVRLSYDKEDEQRVLRCSFAASANIEHVIADYTGGRRFWVFHCEYAGLEVVTSENGPPIGTGKVLDSYPGLFRREHQKEEQMQLLAQMKALCDEGYEAPEADKLFIQNYVTSLVPENPDDMIVSEFDAAIDGLSLPPVGKSSKDGAPVFSCSQVNDIITRLSISYGVNPQRVRALLGRKGRKEKHERFNVYRAREPWSQAPGAKDDITF